ncbi:uncharacterized protein LOC134258320 [Saccostrea cucullata]|uniref:uncharacterized protein LOC134258320 n=1 Tax=Saccostrea cuccullata TaxID=36930 RepID=UPI002ED04A33
MASVNISQLIEKQVWTSVFKRTWNNNEVDLTKDGDKEIVFENSFTEVKHDEYLNTDHTLNIPFKNSDFLTSRKNTSENGVFVTSEKTLSDKMSENNEQDSSRLKRLSSSGPTKEGNMELLEELYDKNVDEIDYFDSDEEYMETHGQRYDERNIMDPFEEYSQKPLKGRYSEGVEQYKNIPVYRRSIQAFAKTNHFEVHDVIHDGNCMFRALADQFMINGRIGFTAESLRCTAIQYLKKKPNKKGGDHIQSFLCTESWEDYLSRMSRSSEWGDHLILLAVVEAFNLEVIVYNVFLDDIRRTEVKPESRRNGIPMQIFLGHLGEFHYLSLRPDHWTSSWPYKSLLYRLVVCTDNLSQVQRQELIQKKITEMGASNIVNQEEFLDMVQIPTDDAERNNANSEMSVKKNHSTGSHGVNLFHCLEELQLEEIEDSMSNIFFDPMHIDVLTGIPLPHLTYFLRQLFPAHMIYPYISARGPLIFPDIYLHCIGSFADGINVFLQDISKNQSKRLFYNRHGQKRVGLVVLTPRNKIVRHSDISEGKTSVVSIFADSTNTHPGYCHLKLPQYTMGISEKQILYKGSDKFLREIEVEAEVSLPADVEIRYKGLVCETFPPSAQEWRNRQRKFTFPSRKLMQKVLKMKCTLMKKAHPRSKEPDIEWKYNFSMAEYIIFTTGLTEFQYHGFLVFKVLVENVTIHLPKRLKNKHLKAVFMGALEDIPCAAWETSFSGCVLFVISALLACLKGKFLPHYFIPTNNLIECYSSQEIEAVCVNIECIRLFPVEVIQNIAENHGYHYAPKLIQMVFENCKSFLHNENLASSLMNAFTPGTLRSIKVMTRLGFYSTAFQLLQYVHEQLLLVAMPMDSYDMPSFLEFFQIALKSLRQKSSRIILAKHFDIRFQTDILKEHIDDKATYAKDVLPWAADFRIGWMEIPKEKSTDFYTLADCFYAYSCREFDKRNSCLSTLAIETGIRCIIKAINTDTIRMEEIEDQILKEEIISQKDQMMGDLKMKLKMYYLHIYAVSKLYFSLDPLINHIDDIEKLCEELPEMSLDVSIMFRYLHKQDKALEYEKKFYSVYKGRENPYDF